jgi:uncharacterized protein YdeI (YjbR/CyaY-like superfamily)
MPPAHLVKHASIADRVEYADAVEEALCLGWVDSKPDKLDAERSLLWFTPRKAGTGWSGPNNERSLRVIEQGQMALAGMQKIRAAQADGSWDKLDAVEDLRVPPDLAAALAARPPAAPCFNAFPRSVKRGILEWILNDAAPVWSTEARRSTTAGAVRTERTRRSARTSRSNFAFILAAFVAAFGHCGAEIDRA